MDFNVTEFSASSQSGEEMSDWELFQKRTQQVSAVVSLLLNSLVVHLVLNHSPKSLGSYKLLIIFTALFEITYSLLEVVVQPIFHSFGSTFAIIINVKDSYLSYNVLKVLISIYCAFFGSLLAIFSIQFVYRYWVVSGNRQVESFNGLKILFWLLIPITTGSFWGLAAYFPCAPRESSDKYLASSVMDEFELDIYENLYIAPYFYEKQEDGSVEIYYPSFVAILCDFLIVTLSMSVAGYYGVKCYGTLKGAMSHNQSEQYRALQTQLFYSLVTQTMIPVILMHIPASAMFLFTFLDINVGSLSGVVTVTIALFPAIDPFPAIFIVKSYRKALQSYLHRTLRVLAQKLEVSESRPDTYVRS